MGSYYLRTKILQALITIGFILIANFLLFRVLPGDPERLLLNNPRSSVSPEALQAQKERWGLDKPLIPDQLVAYVTSTLQGDLGYSFKFRGQLVSDVIGDRIGSTLLLVGVAQVVAIVVGLSLGALAGWKRGGVADYGGTSIALIAYGTPSFWLGMVFLIIFSAGLGWFPTNGMATPGVRYENVGEQIVDMGSHLVLPMTVLALGLIGQYTLLMRASLIEVLGEDYITTARAKGLNSNQVLRRHALPNARLPVVTLIALNLGFIVVGAVTVETVFSWPGIGSLTVDAMQSRDYPVLQGIFLLLSISIVGANLIADLLYSVLDPRVSG
jgi:peptide/nickel transport system permease protein